MAEETVLEEQQTETQPSLSDNLRSNFFDEKPLNILC